MIPLSGEQNISYQTLGVVEVTYQVPLSLGLRISFNTIVIGDALFNEGISNTVA